MGLCQDCGKNEATNIVFDKKKNASFLVCFDCVDIKKDILINHSIENIISFMQD